MAGAQVSVVASAVEKQRLGYQAISLTNFGNTSEPQIAAGSKVEIGSSLFEFTALESITGWSGIAVSSNVYIKLTVSGSSVTASFTTTAPTWDTAKQGWYSGSDRYIGGLWKDSAGNYSRKWIYPPNGLDTLRYTGDGEIIFPPKATGSTTIFYDDDVFSTAGNVYSEVVGYVVPFFGSVSVVFSLAATSGGTAYGRIYKNGAAVGTQRSTSSTSYTAYTETVAVEAGDRLSIYSRTSNPTYPALVKDIYLKASAAMSAIMMRWLKALMKEV